MDRPEISPGIKLGTHMSATAPDSDLVFLKQLGIDHVRVHFDVDQDDPAFVEATCNRFRQHGLSIFSVVYLLYQAREIAFGMPGSDAKLKRLSRFIRTMGDNDLHTLEYDFFLYAPLPETGMGETRGCPARSFDMEKAAMLEPLSNAEIDADAMWEHYSAMMNALLPVAEKAGVRLALHPDDPPVPSLYGVARIFHNIEGLQRAMTTFNSPAWGVLLCIGTWAEGGSRMGMSIEEAIQLFAEHDKLFTVHFRNVSAPLPQFTETFLDNGYVDMKGVMRALQNARFDGLAIPDHFPGFTGDAAGRASLAYAIGYMRGLLE